MSIRVSQTIAAGESGNPIPLDPNSEQGRSSFIMTSVGGDTTITVSATNQKFNQINAAAPTRYVDMEDFSGITVTTSGKAGNILVPISGVKFTNSGANPVIIDFIQGF